ncbi:hypothetical protein EV189_0581 [Motilibacter rhizosphaerae]|uniref:WD40 repeat protein n=1 Tax=Motilibacter rhizosphaerae TaxID=598652 RepID=A0A4Q7NY75_9ACTN|nr:hypothetical protein [Motilibacter rhizosphaerae]RZS91342.1 hypothetical protein EV189_0581 [Motilibacter rhizosphaerae]
MTRTTRRTLLVPAALVALLVACLVGLHSRAALDGPGGALGLPDRLSQPAWGTPSGTASPGGPVALVATGSREPEAGFGDTNAAVMVGPGGYRMTSRIGADEFHPGEDMLLSPDGGTTAYGTGAWTSASVQLTDVRTGRARTLPVGVGSARVVAWTPDSRRFVVAELHRTSWAGIGLLDTSSGRYRRIAEARGTYVPGAVAVSADGSWVAYQGGDSLTVLSVADGSVVGRAALAPGALLTGKAAFTPDGSALVVAVPDSASAPRAWGLRLVDARTGVARPTALPAVHDAVAVRAVGWRPDGSAAVLAFRPDAAYGTDPRVSSAVGDRTRFEAVRRVDLLAVRAGAAAPTTLLRPPADTLAMDVAQQAVASSVVVHLAGQPALVAPVWLLRTGLGLALLGLVALVLLRLPRRPRPAPLGVATAV